MIALNRNIFLKTAIGERVGGFGVDPLFIRIRQNTPACFRADQASPLATPDKRWGEPRRSSKSEGGLGFGAITL